MKDSEYLDKLFPGSVPSFSASIEPQVMKEKGRALSQAFQSQVNAKCLWHLRDLFWIQYYQMVQQS